MSVRRRDALARRAVALLEAGSPVAEVSKSLGIAKSTLYRIRDEHPALALAMSRLDAFAVGEARSVAMLGAPEVMDEVQRLALTSQDERIRLLAAGVLLRYSGLETSTGDDGPVVLEVRIGPEPGRIVDALPEKEPDGSRSE